VNIPALFRINCIGKFSGKVFRKKIFPDDFQNKSFFSEILHQLGTDVGLEKIAEKKELTDDMKREKSCDQQEIDGDGRHRRRGHSLSHVLQVYYLGHRLNDSAEMTLAQSRRPVSV